MIHSFNTNLYFKSYWQTPQLPENTSNSILFQSQSSENVFQVTVLLL